MFCCAFTCATYAGIFLGFCYLLTKIISGRKMPSLKNKHIVVTGGSLGIGRSVAIEAARRGAHVTIMARNVENLEKTLLDVKNAAIDPGQMIQYRSVDLSQNFQDVEGVIKEVDASIAPIYMFVNCAGTAICGKLEDLVDNDIKYITNLNILGTIFPCKALLPLMKARKEGIIVVTASQAAFLGVFGYSAYSATKFALRGFAESLQMEVKPYNIQVTLALPPDTDTPGFAEENKTKPEETRLISESAGLVPPDSVATQMIDDALRGNFFSTVGFESALVSNMCAGMSPFSSYMQLLIQFLGAGTLRLVGVLVLSQFNRIVKKCHQNREKNKKAE